MCKIGGSGFLAGLSFVILKLLFSISGIFHFVTVLIQLQSMTVLKVTSARKPLFAISQPLKCDERFFYLKKKVTFRCQDIKVFVFLLNSVISKALMSSQKMRQVKSCMFNCFLRILGIQPAFTCSNLTLETLEQGVKYVQS